MEFENYSCPVCGKKFISGDDVVVCPECGAPHHRECYEENGHCFFEDKHGEGFTFDAGSCDGQAQNGNDDNATVICPHCKAENPKTTFYCVKCGFPMLENKNNNQNPNPNGQNQQSPFNGTQPNGMPYMGAPFVIQADPMAGFQSNEPVSENVTAGELAKFVGKNTNYFMQIFRTILRYDKSRFNFSAFFLSGAYFLYRKMYALGAIFSFIILALTVFSISIQLTPEYSALYEIFQNNAQAMVSANIKDYFQGMSSNEAMYFLAPSVIEILNFFTMLAAGLMANRRYFKHCIGKINKIKAEAADNAPDLEEGSESKPSVNINEKIESGGGVNLPILIVSLVVYVIVNYLPIFL